MNAAEKNASVEKRLKLLAELIGDVHEDGRDLGAIVQLIRHNTRTPIRWRDTEVALGVAKRKFDADDYRSGYIWSTLALAVLQIIQTELRGIRGTVQRTLLQGTGHANNLEAYAHVTRGAAASELGRLETARDEFERAKELYYASRDGAHEAIRVNIRLARLELLRENWQQAELIAETALHVMRSWGTPADKCECLRVIGHAQYVMSRHQAALDTADQIVIASGDATVLRAQAYLLKAMVELELGQLGNASRDCQIARRLFGEAGERRGIRESVEVQTWIDKKAS